MLYSIAPKEEPGSALSDISRLTEALSLCTAQETTVLTKMADRRLNAVMSTSAGRLFDAVSAICGIVRHSTFEGEASMALEFAAEQYEKLHPSIEEALSESPGHTAPKQCGPEKGEDRWILPTERIVKEITERKLSGEEPELLAYLFHRRLADQIIAACLEISRESGIRTAALSGGCFQNRLLLRMVQRELEQNGIRVLIHHLVPPNDGGIALGQAVAVMQAVHDGILSDQEEE